MYSISHANKDKIDNNKIRNQCINRQQQREAEEWSKKPAVLAWLVCY